MKRIEFILSMPGRSSWNGRWSGEGKHYSIVKKLSDKWANRIMEGKEENSWLHQWDDGWCAHIKARALINGERAKKSDGFCGYNWMVENILYYGDTRIPDKHKEEP